MSTVGVNLKYRVPCADDDKANEHRFSARGGRIPEDKRGKGWKWMFRGQLPPELTAEYVASIERAGSRGIGFDHSELISAIENVPYLEGAEVVIVDVSIYHIGNGNGFPRLITDVQAAFEFKDGKIVKEVKA